MADFIRARNSKQKEERMNEVKAATDELFSTAPYHEITLTTIAKQLSWTRANLYKYVTTKEEIFLELCKDKMSLYFDAFLSAFPLECDYSADVFAQVWTGILNAHKDYLLYSDILCTIVETNVTVERLMEFKRSYYEGAAEISERLHQTLKISAKDSYNLLLAVHYHATGLQCICQRNPLVEQAIKNLNMEIPETNFRDNLKEFIFMNIQYYKNKS